MSLLKFYVAGHDLDACRVIAANLRLKGYEVVSRWLDEPMLPTKEYTPEEKTRIATMDIEDVRSCNVLITFSAGFKVAGGKFVEIGAAIIQGKPVIAIGGADSMLMHHPLVLHVDTFQEAMDLVATKSFLSKINQVPVEPEGPICQADLTSPVYKAYMEEREYLM